MNGDDEDDAGFAELFGDKAKPIDRGPARVETRQAPPQRGARDEGGAGPAFRWPNPDERGCVLERCSGIQREQLPDVDGRDRWPPGPNADWSAIPAEFWPVEYTASGNARTERK